MKRLIVWLFAIVSGLYLLLMGPLPDPLPFLDEATALLIFVKAMGYLGYDVTRWIPFFPKSKRPKTRKSTEYPGVTIDV